MARQSRELSSTGIYHIMFRGNERKNVFQDRQDKERFLDGLELKQKETKFAIYAYCLMDNHVHLLLNTNHNDLASIMKGIAVRYASFYNWKYNRVGHVFQDRFKSEPIENDRYLLAVVRYIHNNPIKAGIVQKPSDYEWSSFNNYLKSLNDNWLDTKFVLSLFSEVRDLAITEFQIFSNELDQSTFLDCEDDKVIRTLPEATVYLKEYLQNQALVMEIIQIKEDKQLRDDIIQHLRSETSLSQRIIAQLLGVDKKVVERIKTT